MITLLPLRGWAGNAIAVDMASQQAVQTLADLKGSAAMPEDCPMHAQTGAETASDLVAADGHCNNCNTCELCLALASLPWPTVAMGSLTPHAGPSSASHPFSSAESITRLKPPISRSLGPRCVRRSPVDALTTVAAPLPALVEIK